MSEIEVGSSLDVLVADKVMGMPETVVDALALGPPSYSTSYELMGALLERMSDLGWWWLAESLLTAPEHERWFAAFGNDDVPGPPNAMSLAPTLPEAVARAALAAVEAS